MCDKTNRVMDSLHYTVNLGLRMGLGGTNMEADSPYFVGRGESFAYYFYNAITKSYFTLPSMILQSKHRAT